MKLISESANFGSVEFLEEQNAQGKKVLYITGPFMESGVVNRNGRRYSKAIMEKEVSRYVKDKVERQCAYGELNHPKRPQLDLERACILINSLDMQKNGQVIGKARVLNTPTGDIVKGLIESGCNLGVSSRGLGTLKEVNGIKVVQEDFMIITGADVVADPSAHNAFVNGVMEGVEWILNEKTGEWTEETKKIIDNTSRTLTENEKLMLFARFLKNL